MPRNQGKPWTYDQEQYLLDAYGNVTLPFLCNKLGKSMDSIKQKYKDLTGHCDPYIASGLYSPREVAPVLGVEHRTVIDWIRHRGFPAKRLHKDEDYHRYYIEPSEMWKWVEENKDRIPFAHVKQGVFLPEPIWLAQEIRNAIKKGLKRPIKWTKEEDELAWWWHKGGVNYREIARRLGRPESGTQRRLTKIRKMKQQLEAI